MATVAKSSITLTSISDSYSLLLTPDSCVIHADFDGTNAILDHASTVVSALCGEKPVPVSVAPENVVANVSSIAFQVQKIDDFRVKILLTQIPKEVLEGNLVIPVTVDVSTKMIAQFNFTVVRESSMLDWIKDWNSNRTTINGASIVTPKVFIGNKNAQDELTGVYIGPAGVVGNSAGIFGYKDNIEIFHIDETGGAIGGWNILNSGIQSANGFLTLNSEGSIISRSNDVQHWALYADGGANFANGNVTFDEQGNAFFRGEIEASKGQIAGWTIQDNILTKDGLGISAGEHYIAIANVAVAPTFGSPWDWVTDYGGIAMFYASDKLYGMHCYSGTNQVFSVGSHNMIASWHFDIDSLYIGSKVNVAQQFTADSASITIGTNGLRGHTWYIDTNGAAVFAGGDVIFNAKGDASFTGSITAASGTIANWEINETALYTGQLADTSGSFSSQIGDITIGYNGIRGYLWRLESDGSGALAGDNIKWDTNGNVTFGESVTLQWSNIKGLTTITSKGIYTGEITAEQITSGTINASLINTDELLSNGNFWALKKDGSGYLANGNITWDVEGAGTLAGGNMTWTKDGSGSMAGGNITWKPDGALTVSGNIKARTGQIGGFLIDNFGNLYQGDLNGWNVPQNRGSLAHITVGSIKLQTTFNHPTPGDSGSTISCTSKVAIGSNAAPNYPALAYPLAPSIGYFYRNFISPNLWEYTPAVQIINDGVKTEVALSTKGAIICGGGLIEKANRMVIDGGETTNNVINLINGTTVLVTNADLVLSHNLFFPTVEQVNAMLNQDIKTPFAVKVTIVSDAMNSQWIYLGFIKDPNAQVLGCYDVGKEQSWIGPPEGDNPSQKIGSGNSITILLIFNGTQYYGQIIEYR